MSASDTVFAGSIPEFYDTFMVPLFFAGYASDLARRVVAQSPSMVLETAAGSGVLARALAPLLPGHSRYVVTDLNQPMLDYAAGRQGADSRLTWKQADALALPFADHTFDAVSCQFGVMFFPDRVAGYAEARRVLKPGGRFLFNSWDRIEENDFAAVVTEALALVFPDDPPRFLARTPHGYHDVALIREELARAGFADISVETIDDVSRAPSARHPAMAYCQGTPLRNEIEARNADLLATATDRAAELVAERHGNGPVSGKIRAHIVTATA